MNPWHKYKPRNDPQGDKAQAENDRMIRDGSQALLITIAKAQAERERRVDEYNAIIGGPA